MRFYTVHEKVGPAGPDADADVVLVKEGFCWPALFFGLIWALYQRLWLVALSVFLLLAGTGVTQILFRGGEWYAVPGMVVLALVLGAEGNNLRRHFLEGKGYAFTTVVVGRDRSEAEMRLFTALGPRIYMP